MSLECKSEEVDYWALGRIKWKNSSRLAEG